MILTLSDLKIYLFYILCVFSHTPSFLGVLVYYLCLHPLPINIFFIQVSPQAMHKGPERLFSITTMIISDTKYTCDR